MKILQDVATAVKLTGEVRKARKAGADAIKVQPIWTVPMLRIGYWGFTGEACILYGKEFRPVVDVFKTFPEEVQHRLTFSPKDGEWGDRVRFWQDALRPVLEPHLYYAAISRIIRWGIRCRRYRLGLEGPLNRPTKIEGVAV